MPAFAEGDGSVGSKDVSVRKKEINSSWDMVSGATSSCEVLLREFGWEIMRGSRTISHQTNLQNIRQ